MLGVRFLSANRPANYLSRLELRPALACSALFLACAKPSAPPAVTGPPPRVEARPSGSGPISSALPPAPAFASAPAAPPPTSLEISVDRVLSVSVSSIALGDGSRVAALGDEPYVIDAHGARALPLPNALRAKADERDELRIFFGRDNEPRIMGTRRAGSAESSVYWRHTSSGWRDGREEIGQLGGTARGGLWGVLGSADPELVCRTNALCILKRTSGWTTAPAGSTVRRVELVEGILWGLDASGLANIDATGWSLSLPAPKWSEPRAFWVSAGEAWVATERALFRYRDRVWLEAPPPISEPAALWGSRSDSIWLVGKGGAAHFDGVGWRQLALTGPLNAVVGRKDGELWFGGEAGLFRSHS
jgi:hypothetical protein